MKEIKNILQTNITECKKHVRAMNYAYSKILARTPLTSTILLEQNDEEIAQIDQFIYRFSKLQDAIGNKLFRSVLLILGEDISNKSAIDIFNKLEQLEIISDYDKWRNLRNLRNELAHEYEEDLDYTAELLNKLLKQKLELESYLDNILKYLENKEI